MKTEKRQRKYYFIQGENILLKEDLQNVFDPYTGKFIFDEVINKIKEGKVQAEEISREKAEQFMKAADLARAAHSGQKDKAGKDYFTHPCRVAKGVRCLREEGWNAESTIDAMTVGLLHDTIEDTSVTTDILRIEGFSEEIVEAADTLTKREDEDYFDYVRKVKRNCLARVVKGSDLRDNMNLSRLPSPTEKDFKRIEKYKKAYAILNSRVSENSY